MSKLGEGGYSFVYLVREISTDEHASAAPTHFALKKASTIISTALFVSTSGLLIAGRQRVAGLGWQQ